MKTTGHATLPSRVSRPPVPLELFLIVTKPVVGPSTAISIELLLAYNNHGASPTYPSCARLLPYIARGHASTVLHRGQRLGAQSPNIPHAGDGAFCGRADVVATAAIAPAIGSNPANTQTPETPHEVHLYETERAPHRR